MGGAARSVGGLAGVEAAVLHDGAADVDVGDDLTMEGDILAHHEPGDGSNDCSVSRLAQQYPLCLRGISVDCNYKICRSPLCTIGILGCIKLPSVHSMYYAQ